MGDADGDAVGSVEACRPCAGEALRGNGLSAGFPVFFGIKKKFKGIVYNQAFRQMLGFQDSDIGDTIEWENGDDLGFETYENVTKATNGDVFVQNHYINEKTMRLQFPG